MSFEIDEDPDKESRRKERERMIEESRREEINVKRRLEERRREREERGKLRREVDWVGGVIASGGLAILAYVLA